MNVRQYIQDCSSLTAKVTGKMNTALAKRRYTRAEIVQWRAELRQAQDLLDVVCQQVLE